MMKKILCLALAVLMLLGLCACSGKKAAWEGKFSVGFGRVDITPEPGIAMGGYTASGEASRVAKGVYNNLYITCVAITDEKGQTALLYTCDVKSIATYTATQLRNAAAEATGVPKAQIAISATHTHSAPDVAASFGKKCKEAVVEAGKQAMADRAPTTMEYGKTEIEGMSFVRHYTTSSGRVIGDNFSSGSYGTITGHTTQADKEVRAVRFIREGKKPVIIANWLGHASTASTGSTAYGTQHRYLLASDYVGTCRDYIEKNSDCLFALYMGASGNINPNSAISGESYSQKTDEIGENLAKHILSCLESKTTGTTGDVKVKEVTYKGKAGNGSTVQMDIAAVGVGSLGFVVAPFEMFDTTSVNIRAESPYDMTFVLTQANGAMGYMPTEKCWDYPGCYEVINCKFNKGTAELLVGEYLTLLRELHG